MVFHNRMLHSVVHTQVCNRRGRHIRQNFHSIIYSVEFTRSIAILQFFIIIERSKFFFFVKYIHLKILNSTTGDALAAAKLQQYSACHSR